MSLLTYDRYYWMTALAVLMLNISLILRDHYGQSVVLSKQKQTYNTTPFIKVDSAIPSEQHVSKFKLL